MLRWFVGVVLIISIVVLCLRVDECMNGLVLFKIEYVLLFLLVNLG